VAASLLICWLRVANEVRKVRAAAANFAGPSHTTCQAPVMFVMSDESDDDKPMVSAPEPARKPRHSSFMDNEAKEEGGSGRSASADEISEDDRYASDLSFVASGNDEEEESKVSPSLRAVYSMSLGSQAADLGFGIPMNERRKEERGAGWGSIFNSIVDKFEARQSRKAAGAAQRAKDGKPKSRSKANKASHVQHRLPQVAMSAHTSEAAADAVASGVHVMQQGAAPISSGDAHGDRLVNSVTDRMAQPLAPHVPASQIVVVDSQSPPLGVKKYGGRVDPFSRKAQCAAVSPNPLLAGNHPPRAAAAVYAAGACKKLGMPAKDAPASGCWSSRLKLTRGTATVSAQPNLFSEVLVQPVTGLGPPSQAAAAQLQYDPERGNTGADVEYRYRLDIAIVEGTAKDAEIARLKSDLASRDSTLELLAQVRSELESVMHEKALLEQLRSEIGRMQQQLMHKQGKDK